MSVPRADPAPTGRAPSRAGGARRPMTLRGVLAVVLVVVVVGVMIRLSIWQWDKARAHGALLNYTYAVEWLLFAGLTIAGCVRLVVESRRLRPGTLPAAAGDDRQSPVPAGPVPLVGPPLRPGEELEEITWVRLRRRLGLGGG